MNPYRALLVFAFLISTFPALALENDAAREEMPGQDANLTSDTVHMAPTERPPVNSGPDTYVGDAESQASDEAPSLEDEEKLKEEKESQAEIEVFVPKPKRHIWKDEVQTDSAETGATAGSSISDKLNKISGGSG
jgi:hypothetical protein